MAGKALLKVLEEQQESIQQQSRLIVELVDTIESLEQTAGYDGEELKERARALCESGIETEIY
mgnify:FL=1